MNAPDSSELLHEFSRTGSEAAFGELVRRHLDLVYSAALRRSRGDAALAADVAQTVFTDLVRQVRNSGRRSESVLTAQSLAGWLHRHTCFVTANALRSEVRRRSREETAMQLHSLSTDPDWSRIAPELDEALSALPDSDRDALVLRFFEQATFARVGASLGTTEDAARRRVERALDKLREQLAKRGVTSTAAVLATSLAAHAVTPAPTALAGTIQAAAFALPATGSTVSFLGFKTLSVGVAASLAVSGWFFSRQTGRELRQQNDFLRAEVEALTAGMVQRDEELETLRRRLPGPDELARLASERAELLRLRGEIARLRRELAEAASEPAQPTPEAATPVPDVQFSVTAKFLDVPESLVPSLTSVPLQSCAPISSAEAEDLLESARQIAGIDILGAPAVTTLSGRQAQIAQIGDDGRGVSLDVLPTILDENQISLMTMAGREFGELPPEGIEVAHQVRAVPAANWCRVVLADGQSVLLHQPGSHPAEAGERHSLLVLVTAVGIDPAGNRLTPEAGSERSVTPLPPPTTAGVTDPSPAP